MAIEKRELDVAKECDDVMVLVVELVKDLKAKKEMAQVVAENLPHLMTALDGVQNLPEEVKAHRGAVMATVGYRAGELTDALIGEEEAAPAE